MAKRRIAKFRVACQNLPRKRFLLSGKRQVRALVRLLNRRGVEIVALQEVYNGARDAFERNHPRWTIVSAPPNNRRRSGYEIGNSIAFRNDRWRILDQDFLHLDLPGAPRGLNLPVVLLKNRRTHARLVVICVHLPTKRRTRPEVRDALRAEIERYTRTLQEQKFAWVVLGDFNDRDSHRRFRKGRLAASAHVDQIITAKWRGLKVLRSFTRWRGVRGRISDHPLVMAKVRLKTRWKRQTSLPRAR